jgi:hypothetical protein
MLISAQLVQKIFTKQFGARPDVDELFEVLLSYQDEGQVRVHIAILKLCEGDPDKLMHYVNVAKTDFRDVLAWAEYPEQTKSGATAYNSPSDVYQDILKRDKQQYQLWIEEQSRD